MSFIGFGKSSNVTTTGSPFSFLSKVSAVPADASNTSTTKSSFSFGTVVKTPPNIEKEEQTSSGNGNVVKGSAKENKGKSASYQNKIKSLNKAVTEWIRTHVEKNSLCILTPIFKDYDKYIKEIEEEEQKTDPLKVDNDSESVKKASSDTPTLDNFKFSAFSKPSSNIVSTTGAGALFSFSSTSASSATVPTNSSIFTSVSKPATETTKPSTFSFGIKPAENKNNLIDDQTSPSPKVFSFGLKTDNKPSTSTSSPLTFGKSATNGDSSEKKPPSFSFAMGSAPFSFGNIKAPADPTPSTSAEANGADNEEDQPPKVEFKQVFNYNKVSMPKKYNAIPSEIGRGGRCSIFQEMQSFR